MEKMKASLAFANLANPSHTLCLADSTCVIAIARPANMSSPRAISASCSVGIPGSAMPLQSVGHVVLFSLSLHVLSPHTGSGAQFFVSCGLFFAVPHWFLSAQSFDCTLFLQVL